MSTPPPAPEPHDGTPRPGGAQPAYGAPQPEYGAQQPGYAPPAPSNRPGTKGPRGLGLIAFLVALAGAVIGSILATIGGIQTGALVQYTGVDTTTVDPNTLPPEAQQSAVVGGLLVIAGYLVWGVLALWGLIQGIIAAVKNRGRGWGIAAIVIAILGLGAVSTAFGIGVAIGAGPYVGM